MKLKEIKEWIENLPKEFLEFECSNAEFGDLDDKSDDEHEYTYRLDKPITALNVDEDHKEILFLNDKP